MKRIRKVAALWLAAAMLLSGCGGIIGDAQTESVTERPEDQAVHIPVPVPEETLAPEEELQREMIRFADMEYIRPDVETLHTLLRKCNDLAQAGEDFEALEDALEAFFEAYNSYATNYALADIYYCMDLTDSYWTEEYNFCLETSSEVDAGTDRLYYTLAECPFREELESDDLFGEGFFDAYEGESLWDESFTSLMEEEAALISTYYELSAQLSELDPYGDAYQTMQVQISQLFADMVRLRQEIAADAGYEDYQHFAYDFYYARDYTPEQETAYVAAVRDELVPLYRYIYENGLEGAYYYECTEEAALSYVRDVASAMGGQVEEAFAWMEAAGLYDIGFGQNKYGASFETYLWDYDVPFVFMDPKMTSYDKLTFSHEFGHFCNDFASHGTGVGIDVAEVFSQGMEYLGLIYGDQAEELELLSMFSSLCVQVEQSAYACFEQRVYQLPQEDVTAEEIRRIFSQVTEEFGFGFWGADGLAFTGITHFFTNPMYVFSYVVSNDAAMQLYQMEREEQGAGLKTYQGNLTTEETYFLAFVESAGMRDPFEEGRLEDMRQTLEEILK